MKRRDSPERRALIFKNCPVANFWLRNQKADTGLPVKVRRDSDLQGF